MDPDGEPRQRVTRKAALRAVWRRASAWTLLLAALCFLMPFVAVSCDVPGGFGGQGPGGTTTYRGVDLVTGSEPQVTGEHVRPPEERRSARLGVQPFLVVALALTVTAFAASVLLRLGRARRIWVAATSAGAALALVVGQLAVRNQLAAKVAAEVGDRLPPDRRAVDYVHNENGFWATTALLVLVAVVSAAFAMRDSGAGAAARDPRESAAPDGPVPHTG